MTAGALFAVATVTGVSVLWAMTTVGAQSRVMGLHVPFIHKNARTWEAGQQAGRWVIFPTAAVALVFAVLAMSGLTELAAIGWSVWLLGLLAGGVIASIAAQRATS